MAFDKRDIASLEATSEVLDRTAADVRDAFLQQQMMIASGILAKVLRYARAENQVAPRVNGLAAQQPSGSEFKGLSLAEAAVKQLSFAKKSQTVSEIIDALVLAGFAAGRAPRTQITAALERRSRNYADLVRVKKGTWCLREYLTPEEVSQIEHNQRTKKGVRQAMKRGVRYGPKPKITEDMAKVMKPLISAGRSLRDVGAAVGVSHTTVQDWKDLIEAWEPGQHWPPNDRGPYAEINEQADNVTPLRAVK
jgi:hypothetical protein